MMAGFITGPGTRSKKAVMRQGTGMSAVRRRRTSPAAPQARTGREIPRLWHCRIRSGRRFASGSRDLHQNDAAVGSQAKDGHGLVARISVVRERDETTSTGYLLRVLHLTEHPRHRLAGDRSVIGGGHPDALNRTQHSVMRHDCLTVLPRILMEPLVEEPARAHLLGRSGVDGLVVLLTQVWMSETGIENVDPAAGCLGQLERGDICGVVSGHHGEPLLRAGPVGQRI